MKRNIHPVWGTMPLFAAFLFTLFFLTACKAEATDNKQALPQRLFRDGDIAFRRGTGMTSRVVLAADRQGVYSHTGILKSINGQWYVIHAVPGEPEFKADVDRVKMEAVAHFFASPKATKGAVMRLRQDSVAARKAADSALRLFRARTLFDHSYNLKDTTKMYCTELIDYVYRKEGIQLPEGRISRINIPGLQGEYLLPNDIIQSSMLCLIYQF